jgi:pimeloyl-ACP methyl ester carboxylesterase
MPTIALNGFNMYVEVRGEGTPLLLLHGGMGIGADWRHIFSADPPGYRLIVPDLRGHGRSSNPARVFTFRQCALDVLALLDHLGVQQTKAVGLSLGAKTLLHVGTIRPEAVRTMVLVSAAPYFPSQLRAAASQFTPDAFQRLTETELQALRGRHVHGDDQIAALYGMTFGFAASYDDLAFTPPQLSRIAARTLIVHGDRDPLYPVELGVELYRSIPSAALWVVPNGGHGPIFGENAMVFRDKALAFLAA